MAPAILQGDAFGWGIYSYGINIRVGILGIADQCAWTGGRLTCFGPLRVRLSEWRT